MLLPAPAVSDARRRAQMVAWLAELRRLNDNLAALVGLLRDIRAMAADTLGWRIKEGE